MFRNTVKMLGASVAVESLALHNRATQLLCYMNASNEVLVWVTTGTGGDRHESRHIA